MSNFFGDLLARGVAKLGVNLGTKVAEKVAATPAVAPVVAAGKQVADAGVKLAKDAFAEAGASGAGDSVVVSRENLKDALAAQAELKASKAQTATERSAADKAVSPNDLAKADPKAFIAAPPKLVFTSLDDKAATELAKQLNIDPKAYAKFAEAAKNVDFKTLRREFSDTKLQLMVAAFLPAWPFLALWNVFQPAKELHKMQAIREARASLANCKFVEPEGGKAILLSELEAVKDKDDIRMALMERIAALESKAQANPAGLITAALLRAYMKDISAFAMMPASIDTGHSRKNPVLMDIEALKGGGPEHLKKQFADAKYWDNLNTQTVNFVLAAMLTVHQAQSEKTKDRLSGAYEQFGRVNTMAASIRKASKNIGSLMEKAIQTRLWLGSFASKPEIKALETAARKSVNEFVDIIKTQHDHGQANLTTRLTDFVTSRSGEIINGAKAVLDGVGITDKAKMALGLNKVLDTALTEARGGLKRGAEILGDKGRATKLVTDAIRATASPLFSWK